MRQKFPLYSSLFTAFAVVAGLIALVPTSPNPIRWFLTIASLLLAGTVAGNALWPNHQSRQRIFWGCLSHLAAITVAGTAIYYLHDYSQTMTRLVIIALPIIWHLWQISQTYLQPNHITATPTPSQPPSTFPISQFPSLLLSLAAIIFYSLAIHAWFAAGTNLAIRSPWEIASPNSLIFIVLGTIAAIIATRRHSLFPIIALTLGFIATTTVAIGVYRAGYGFDPFLHRAAETIVVNTGAVTPKTPYYVGQYVLIATGQRLTGLTVDQLDRWLLPLLAALLIPATYSTLRRRGLSTTSSVIGSTAALLAPLSGFIVTTPQGLANLFATLAILSAVSDSELSFSAFLIASAAICIHPLAGIPIFIGLASGYLFSRHHHLLSWLVFFLAATSVPLMFIANAHLSGNSIELTFPTSLQIFLDQFIGHLPYRRFNLWFDLAYWWKSAGLLIFLIIGLSTWFKKNTDHFPHLRTPILISSALLINAIILKGFIRFPFLVTGEQLIYGSRLLELATLTLIPVVAIWLATLTTRQTIALTITIAALVAANTYAAYPHLDAYESSRGFSTSTADLEAAHIINTDAGSKLYLVLSNQSAAAAAIQEFGFKHYFLTNNQPLFYYPVPTTSPLAELFTQLMASPQDAKKIINQAKQLTNFQAIDHADTVYVIVDDYWWDAAGVNRTLTKLADKNWDVQNGAARVYKFTN